MTNRSAIITGASRANGIGAAICRELAKAGHDIFFTYWSTYDQSMPWGMSHDEPSSLQQEIEALGRRCAFLEIDLSQVDAPEQLFNEVERVFGVPDILVNNAAYSTETNYMNLSADELDKHYFMNVRATTLLSVEFGRRFEKKSGGRIVNLTSGQSLGPMPGEIAYAATKGAIDALTVTLSAELAPKGITVNAVNPGPTDTGWMSNPLKEELLTRFPFGRIGEPSDAARLVTFLTSPEAEWITGQVIHSEGGFKR